MSALEQFRDKWNFFDEIVYKVTCAICISLIIIMTFEVLVHECFSDTFWMRP